MPFTETTLATSSLLETTFISDMRLIVNANTTIVKSKVEDIINDLQIDLPHNIKLIVFNYEETTLDEYYNHLSHMDLVFGGGTTGLLDASFLGIPVLAIKFEVIDQNFWQSSLRHFDYFSWTSDFFIEAKVPIANSEFELKNFILNYTNISHIDKVAVIKFTGNPNLDISEVLLSKIITFN
jgi:hypothetical protein